MRPQQNAGESSREEKRPQQKAAGSAAEVTGGKGHEKGHEERKDFR